MKEGANVQAGVYTGDGSDDRNISGLGFQPEWVMTMGDNQEDIFRPALLPGDASFVLNGADPITDRIQAITSDGFQVGAHNNVNRSAFTYYWIAFEANSKVSVGTYTGNGVDNRNITGVGFDPRWVWIKRQSSNQGVWRSNTMTGDVTSVWGAAAFANDRIQSLITDGFQVGTSATVNGASGSPTFYYLAVQP
jgi:hypothetical protein